MTSSTNIETPCQWCKSAACTPEASPHCYCLDCGTRLSPCKCLPDCPGGNCYQSSCCDGDPDSAEYVRKREELSKQLGRLTAGLA